jgi:hypothetical protein
MMRWILCAVISVLITAVLLPVASAQENLSCLEFDSQAEAQQRLKEDPTDPDGLDGPPGEAFTGIEGVACEDLPPPEDLTPVLSSDDGLDPLPSTVNVKAQPGNVKAQPSNVKAQAGGVRAQADNVTAQDERDTDRLLEAGGDLPLPHEPPAGTVPPPDDGGSWPLRPLFVILLSAGVLGFAVYRLASRRAS